MTKSENAPPAAAETFPSLHGGVSALASAMAPVVYFDSTLARGLTVDGTVAQFTLAAIRLNCNTVSNEHTRDFAVVAHLRCPIHAYQSANQNYDATLSGLFGIGSGLAGLGGKAIGGGLITSDVRAKTDIRRVGTLDNGLPVYAFRYKAGGPMQIGLMAHDVEKVRPEAVGEIGGFKAVDYGMAVEVARSSGMPDPIR